MIISWWIVYVKGNYKDIDWFLNLVPIRGFMFFWMYFNFWEYLLEVGVMEVNLRRRLYEGIIRYSLFIMGITVIMILRKFYVFSSIGIQG